jgi:predicted permease
MTNRRGDGFFEGLGRDLRYAFRSLRREPTFAAGVVLTFALAIGMNASMFGLVARLMLAPPPGIREADRVARVRLHFFDEDGNSFVASTTSYPTFRALRAQRNAFAMVGAAKPDTVRVGRAPNVTPIGVLGVSYDYLGALGATPAYGRFFGPGDDEPPTGSSVIVLGHAYWQRAFGGEPSVLGREIVIDDQPFTVVGIARPGFNGAELGAVDAFLPLSASLRLTGDEWPTNRFMNLVSVVVRLADGVSAPTARQMASAALREQADGTGRMSAAVELVPMMPGAESRRSAQSRIALWLAGVSVVVLLIATANVGTLLSLRSARRRREIAVRVAMGAGHGHLARQLLAESLLLAVIGAAAGLLLSRWFSQLLRVTMLPGLAPSDRFVDYRVLVSSLLVSCAAGVLAGLVPLAQAGRTNVSEDLRAGGHGISGRLAFQNTLVRVQVALCAVLLVGAALFVRSLQRVQSQDLGFSTTSLLYTQLDFRGYVSGPERDLAYYEAVRRLRSLNGVTSATVVAGIPFGPHYIPPVSVPGTTWPAGVQVPIMYGATPEYLDMMEVRLVEGRLLAARDGPGAPPVVLVNESMARTLWPGESALGKCVRVGFGTFPPTDEENPSASAPCRTVVGVVRDSRARSLRPEGNEDRLMQYYVAFEQMPLPPRPDPSRVMGLMVRVRGDAARAVGHVQRTIQSTSAVPVSARTPPYQDLLDPQLRSWRLGASLFSTFSILALGIAAVGLFGVVSYVVTQRTQEIGVRLALGGTSARVASLIIRDALSTVSIGVGVGLLGAIAAGPLIGSMLFQTSPREPASLATAAMVLLAATVVAAAWPAWRAGRVDPVRALRAD